jgi:hypothetical protein
VGRRGARAQEAARELAAAKHAGARQLEEAERRWRRAAALPDGRLLRRMQHQQARHSQVVQHTMQALGHLIEQTSGPP